MKRLIAILSCWFALSAVAAPASPQSGLWWSPSESGRGYTLDAQNEYMVVAFFGYDDSGKMQWYYAEGPLGCGGYCWSGVLYKFDNGQPLNGSWRANTITGNAGTISMAFTSRVTGTLTLPSGRQVAIQRFNHSAGSPPQALLGQWSYTYLIGSSWFVDVYALNAILGATSNGSGVVANSARDVGFEFQTSGALAGYVAGFHFSSTGAVLDQYLYQLQVEEGRGFWVSPTTSNQYGMNVQKMYTAAGTAKRSSEPRDERPTVEKRGMSIAEISRQDPELGRIAQELWERLQAR